mmetsp:Transcript_12616/g.22852  ORF Transcript_12616/g.22852 Transcript_12616/m.22852 type:complete len:109 (+) Transcript_12616:753-1079(+)
MTLRTMTQSDHPHVVGVLIETLGVLSLDRIEKMDSVLSDDESASSSKTSDTESTTTICTDDEQQRNGTCLGERRVRFPCNPVAEIREFRRIEEELRPILFYSAYDYIR